MILVAILILLVIFSHDLIEREKALAEQGKVLDVINLTRSEHLRFMAQREAIHFGGRHD